MELGYQLIYLLRPNMVNEHSTTNEQSELKVLFLASSPARKMDEKNHLAANLNKAETVSLKNK